MSISCAPDEHRSDADRAPPDPPPAPLQPPAEGSRRKVHVKGGAREPSPTAAATPTRKGNGKRKAQKSVRVPTMGSSANDGASRMHKMGVEEGASESPKRSGLGTKPKKKKKRSRHRDGTVWAALEADGDVVLPDAEASSGDEDAFRSPQSLAGTLTHAPSHGRAGLDDSRSAHYEYRRPLTATAELLLGRVGSGGGGGGGRIGSSDGESLRVSSPPQHSDRHHSHHHHPPAHPFGYEALLDDGEVERQALLVLRERAEEEALAAERRETEAAYMKTAVSYRALRGLPPPTAEGGDRFVSGGGAMVAMEQCHNSASDGGDSEGEGSPLGPVSQPPPTAGGNAPNAALLETLPPGAAHDVCWSSADPTPRSHTCLTSPLLSAREEAPLASASRADVGAVMAVSAGGNVAVVDTHDFMLRGGGNSDSDSDASSDDVSDASVDLSPSGGGPRSNADRDDPLAPPSADRAHAPAPHDSATEVCRRGSGFVGRMRADVPSAASRTPTPPPTSPPTDNPRR